MKIKRDDAFFLFIDIQEKFIPHIHKSSELLKQISILIQGVETLKIPYIVSEQNPDKLGQTENSISRLMQQYSPFHKMCFSCAENDSLLQKIKESGRNSIILCGIEAHICVLQTAMDLIDLGFKVYVLEDGVSSRTEFHKQNGLNRIRQHSGIITNIESVLFELCGIAGTDEFRLVSKLIK